VIANEQKMNGFNVTDAIKNSRLKNRIRLKEDLKKINKAFFFGKTISM
jgi:hypothetical protein